MVWKWKGVISKPDFPDEKKSRNTFTSKMYPLLFSCKQCAETFVSSKNLRSHGCNGMSNNERTSKGGKREEVLGEVVEIEGESNKHFETKFPWIFPKVFLDKYNISKMFEAIYAWIFPKICVNKNKQSM